MARKVTHSLISQKEKRNMAIKKSIKEAMTISPDLVDTVNHVSLTSEG